MDLALFGFPFFQTFVQQYFDDDDDDDDDDYDNYY